MTHPEQPPFTYHHLGLYEGRLESFKRDGTPIRTPIWFAEDHGVLYVYTIRWREIPRTHVLLTIVGWVCTGVAIVMALRQRMCLMG